jgi:hypothetical protein
MRIWEQKDIIAVGNKFTSSWEQFVLFRLFIRHAADEFWTFLSFPSFRSFPLHSPSSSSTSLTTRTSASDKTAAFFQDHVILRAVF